MNHKPSPDTGFAYADPYPDWAGIGSDPCLRPGAQVRQASFGPNTRDHAIHFVGSLDDISIPSRGTKHLLSPTGQRPVPIPARSVGTTGWGWVFTIGEAGHRSAPIMPVVIGADRWPAWDFRGTSTQPGYGFRMRGIRIRTGLVSGRTFGPPVA